MKLIYCKIKEGNVGDDLNPWLWKRFLPDFFDEDTSVYFIGIGTLLCDKLPKEGKKIVFGSGAGYGNLPQIDSSWKFYCVRGPLTAKALGLKPNIAVTDSAALIGALAYPNISKEFELSFMPHHFSAQFAKWKDICDQIGLNYIDPRWDVDRVIDSIRKTKILLTEAMHGAILADSLRVPWVPIKIYDHVLDFKWIDWCSSMNLEYAPVRLNEIYDFDHIFSFKGRVKIKVKRILRNFNLYNNNWTLPAKKSCKKDMHLFVKNFSKITKDPLVFLSKDSIFNTKKELLLDLIEQVKIDYCAK